MPWNHQYSPLDKTIDQLEWLAGQMRVDLSAGSEITPDDYGSVLVFVQRIIGELKPLQDLRVQEQR
jgi:hypothetical protein